MMEMMLSNIKKIKMQGNNLKEIKVSDEIIKKLGINSCKNFFSKFDFTIKETISENLIIKYIN
jgi:cell division septal protein FtsQ